MISCYTYGHRPFRICIFPSWVIPTKNYYDKGLDLMINKLSGQAGIMVPSIKSAKINEQLAELRACILRYGQKPVILIADSWRAWLSFIFASQNPSLVKKLILISNYPYEKRYDIETVRCRLKRLGMIRGVKLITLQALSSFTSKLFRLIYRVNQKKGIPLNIHKLNVFIYRHMQALYNLTDYYSLMPSYATALFMLSAAHRKLIKLRNNGELLNCGRSIGCPVTVVHGDYDPRPFDGVKIPLTRVLKNVRFILIQKCGIKPWREKYAYQFFVRKLQEECAVTE